MFSELHPIEQRLRNYRTVAASIAAHVVVLVAILVHRGPIVELEPMWLANGSGTHSYRVIYSPENGTATDEDKVVLAKKVQADRHRPKASVSKPVPERLQVPPDAIASDHSARAGSELGTVIDGPIEGHEVHVAYPVVFPDPRVARSELPPDVKGDVIVEITIDAQGNVIETKVVQAIGHGIDEKIVAALRQWRYQPATLDGVPVASKHDVHFHFPS